MILSHFVLINTNEWAPDGYCKSLFTYVCLTILKPWNIFNFNANVLPSQHYFVLHEECSEAELLPSSVDLLWFWFKYYVLWAFTQGGKATYSNRFLCFFFNQICKGAANVCAIAECDYCWIVSSFWQNISKLPTRGHKSQVADSSSTKRLKSLEIARSKSIFETIMCRLDSTKFWSLYMCIYQ